MTAPLQPHMAIVHGSAEIVFRAHRPQKNRQRKLVCNHCGFICRASRQQIERASEGLICPIPVCDGDLELQGAE